MDAPMNKNPVPPRSQSEAAASSDPPSVVPRLQQALEAIDKDDPAQALDTLLAAWREKGAREIADAIDVASKVCRVGQEPIAGATEAKRQAEWLAVEAERRPVDLERLLESMIARDAGTSAGRVALLARWPRNPRLSSALLELRNKAPFRGAQTGFWGQVKEAVLTVADARITTVTAHFPFFVASQTFDRQVKKLFASGVPALTATEAETCATITSRLRAALAPRVANERRAARDGAALLQAIYDHPADDERRLVYADWLSEQGDPRGEFIMLQFERHKGTLSSRGAARERALFQKHYRGWLGGVASRIRRDGVRFERGFLASGRLHDVHGWDYPIEWSTCSEIDFSRTRYEASETLSMVERPRFGCVDSVLGAHVEVLTRLVPTTLHGGLGARLRRVGGRRALRNPDDLARWIAQLPRLEELRWFESGDLFATLLWVTRGPLAERLQRFEHSERVSGFPDKETLFAVERGADGRLSRLRVSSSSAVSAPTCMRALEVLSSCVRELVVVSPAREGWTAGERAGVQAICDRLALTRVELPGE